MQTAVDRGPLDRLWDEWGALHVGSTDATPFTSVGWARAWWPHYGRDAQPFLVTVRDGDRLVGLAPLVLRRRGPVRALDPIGMGPGDYWDVLAAPGHRVAVARAVARELRERSGEWDVWRVRCLPPASPVTTALAEAGLPVMVRRPIQAPAIELPGDFETYLAGLPGSHRRNLRRHLRRLDEGDVRLREVADAAAMPAAVARWQSFRGHQWSTAGKEINAEHLSQRFAAFVLDVLRELVPAGRALMWDFTVDDEVVGSYVNFVDADSFYWYLGGFDPSVASLGLGKIAIAHGIRTSIAAGRRRYDFTRGDEPYKYWYGATDRPLVDHVVGSGSRRSRSVLSATRLALRPRVPRRLISSAIKPR